MTASGISDVLSTAPPLRCPHCELGYPAAGSLYGPTGRRPVEEVTFDEQWEQRWKARP